MWLQSPLWPLRLTSSAPCSHLGGEAMGLLMPTGMQGDGVCVWGHLREHGVEDAGGRLLGRQAVGMLGV